MTFYRIVTGLKQVEWMNEKWSGWQFGSETREERGKAGGGGGRREWRGGGGREEKEERKEMEMGEYLKEATG